MKMVEALKNVYDSLFPSPPALKEIVYISIAVDLWRQEINTHSINYTWKQLNLQKNILSSNSMSCCIPSSIMSEIETHVSIVGSSIQEWLSHHQSLFHTEIFHYFIDFVGDFDGSIHYVRTAKRFILCDRINQVLRFKMACTYCFEDDILRIWPRVSTYLDLKDILFHNDPALFYWVSRLQRQLYKIPRSNLPNQSNEERVIQNRFITRSSAEYFWRSLDAESRMRIAASSEYYPYFVKILSRYLLREFDEVDLDQFANTNGHRIIVSLLKKSIEKKGNEHLYALLMWTYLRNKMNGDSFVTLIRSIIRDLGQVFRCLNDTSAYIELWTNAPNHLKQQAIQAVSRDNSVFQTSPPYSVGVVLFQFLFTLLSDASIEDRSTFWSTHWSTLLYVMSTIHLDLLITLCFNNDEKEIAAFKQSSLSKCQNVRKKYWSLLENHSFDKLNKFLNFCFPDKRKQTKIRLNLLKKCTMNYISISDPFPLNDFINDSCNDVNEAADFKTQLLSSPSTVAKLQELVNSNGQFHQVIQFIDTFAPSKQAALDVKRLHIFPIFQRRLLAGDCVLYFKEHQFLKFLLECFGDDDEIARFKQTLNVNRVDEIVQHGIRCAMYPYGCLPLKYNPFLAEFLEWYFDTPQALEEFKSRYAHDYVFVKLIDNSA